MRSLVISIGLLLSVAGKASAGPVNANEWYQFCFGGAGTWAYQNSPGCVAPYETGAALPPWTYHSNDPFAFYVGDLFDSGDRFTVFNFATSLGSTTPAFRGGDCGNNPVLCGFSPFHSKRAYLLAAGTYSFRINIRNSPFEGGAGTFRIIDATPDVVVPEPATMGLMAIGLVGLTLAGRRRRLR